MIRPPDLNAIYRARFPEADRGARDELWQVLCRHFFQAYVKRTDTVVDVGAGFGEFLRHINCSRRIAVDLAPLAGRRLPPGTIEIATGSAALSEHLAADSVDVVFCSNVFEHLPNAETFLATLGEVRAILKPGGTLLVLQPNIRFVKGAYWDFVDHHLPLTDQTLIEAATSVGLDPIEVIPRFLPYTTRSGLPQWPMLVRAYLALRPAWRIFGKQTFFVARKPEAPRA